MFFLIQEATAFFCPGVWPTLCFFLRTWSRSVVEHTELDGCWLSHTCRESAAQVDAFLRGGVQQFGSLIVILREGAGCQGCCYVVEVGLGAVSLPWGRLAAM